MASITLGENGSSLSSSSVYKVSSCGVVANVRIDSSAMKRFSSRNTPSIKRNSFGFPQGLTKEETRASLAVLLNKLILSTSGGARDVLPVKIVEILNSKKADDDECLESSGEIDVTEGENVVLENSCASLIGICSIIDHKCTTLSQIVDSIAALSCEVSKADISSFSSGDGDKDEIGVAGDLRVLLNGYKGKLEIEKISEIPCIHGIFRSVVKNLNAVVCRELNSGVKRGGKTRISKALGTTLSPFPRAIKDLGEGSFHRTKLCFESIVNNENLILSNGLSQVYKMSCDEYEKLNNSYKLAFNALLDEDYCRFAQELNASLGIVWRLVGLEAVAAFFALDGGELFVQNADDKEESKKSDKKKNEKKKAVLGKGTSDVIQFIKTIVKDKVVITETASDDDKKNYLNKWVEIIKNLINPESEIFLDKVKEIVESNEKRRIQKPPKGTRDFTTEQMAVRQKVFSIVRKVFKRHGGGELGTPAFELRETLMRKYGDDAKLVFDLADQGGERCSLRYDLTVPFARYMAMNGLKSFKGYQIGMVYRRDKPARGRSREFCQCDFDIAGLFEPMVPDCEVIKILTELLDELEIGDYQVKLSHRKLLVGILEICGVPAEKFTTICSSIDKLDKQSFEQVKKEMVEEKGLSSEMADEIGKYVNEKGAPLELLSKLRQERPEFLSNKSSREALDELSILFKLLKISKCSHRIVFDLSLARGLDYYTGVIFEAVCIGDEVGSIGAGGRYDELIGTMMGETKQVPSVGMSLGIERVFTIMEERNKKQKQVIRGKETQVLVSIMVDNDNKAAEMFELVTKLWEAEINADYLISKRMTKHLKFVKEAGIPWLVMLGEQELNGGVVTLRKVVGSEERIKVPRDSFVAELLKRL